MPRGRPPKDTVVQNNATDLVNTNTVEEIVKKKRTRPDHLVHTSPGDNTKYINHALTFMKWSKPDMTNEEAVRQRIIDYFETCEQNDMKPSVESLALAFGVERKTLWSWANGVDSKFMSAECRSLIKIAYATLNAMMADYMQNGKINPVAGIFLMKNNMSYSDQTEIVVTPNNPIGAELSQDELQKRISDGVIVEVPDDD